MKRRLANLHRLGRAVAVAALVCFAEPATAVSLIRDAETEAVLRRIADPIFTAAKLDPESIDIYIVNDPKLNAFVAGGQNLFVNTGLILRTDKPEELAGVIAHETGHIAGGHLSRMAQAQQQAGIPLLAGMLLLGHIVGSFDLDVVLASGTRIVAHPLYLTTLILFALGALTKSAQVPFHFWLPRAMVAPTRFRPICTPRPW